MKIKTKLRLGIGFLFVIILGFGGISIYFMNRISEGAKLVLKDNYQSIQYIGKMQAILEDNTFPLSAKTEKEFAKQLSLAQQNVTEPGEQQAMYLLKAAFKKMNAIETGTLGKPAVLAQMYKALRSIDEINMAAIVSKNAGSQRGVEQYATYLIFAATLCFLILFSFVVNFPGFVANPLREFSAALKEISRKNYKQRLEFGGSDEFSELAEEFNLMSAQLNKWESSNFAKLQSEKLRIEAIIEQMQDAIIGLNEKQEILFLNTVASVLFNLSESDAVGKSAPDLMKKNDLLNRIMGVRNATDTIKIYANNKESYFQLERRLVLLPNAEVQEQVGSKEGKAAGEVYILKNITAFKELDDAKTHFIATVSHELKTPIASIKMSLQLLDDERVGVMNREQKDLMNHIKDDCGRLLKITSELLNLAQVETGKLQLNFAKTDPRKIANYAMDTVRFQAEQKSIDFDLIAADDLSNVNVDTEKTAWVLINFLSNALRYSPERTKIIIRIEESVGLIIFSVQDFGKGIDEQYQKHLFEKYFQVPTDGNNKSGSGLGLAISKDFIEAEGGRIWVESGIGEGSRFCFELPAVS
ncbi:MAG: ATP-binding protein [Bacteroidota bacterium]